MPYEILLQHASIVSCLCVFGISHFGLYYLYSSTSNYKNEWIWKKKKNKNFIAEIVIVHEVKTAQIFLRIYKNKEYIREFEILSTYPDEFYFSQYLGRIKWVDDKTVVIEQKNGINYLLIDINKGIIKDWSEKE